MGKEQSRPPSPPLTEEPWRKTRGWSGEIRRELKQHIAGLSPASQGDWQIPFFNILLTGLIGSGKSSFYNSLNSVFGEGIYARSEVRNFAQSLTNKYRVYETRVAPDIPPLPFRICDTMGLDQVPNEIDIRNIMNAVDGHVPDGFVFEKEREIDPDTPEYINIQSLSDKAHCVAIVIDANTVSMMKKVIIEKLKSLRRGLMERELPTFILLTHIDHLCPEVNRDVTKVYNSKAIHDLVTKTSRLLHGLPENQVFPVMNYTCEIGLDDNMDILLLTALRQMLYSAQGYLESRM